MSRAAAARRVKTYTTTINFGEYDNLPFQFTYRTDGTGTARDMNYEQEVSFTWEPTILEDLDEGEIDDTLQEHARELFWDEINEQFGDDRLLQEEDYGTSDLVFESGSNEELERVSRLIVYSFPALWDDGRDDVELTIRARTETEGAFLDSDYGLMDDPEVDDEIKTAITGLIDLALGWNDPYGWSLEYNDGAYGRASGYDESANTVDYTIARPSFHEMAEAREELLRIFAEHELEEAARPFLPEGE